MLKLYNFVLVKNSAYLRPPYSGTKFKTWKQLITDTSKIKIFIFLFSWRPETLFIYNSQRSFIRKLSFRTAIGFDSFDWPSVYRYRNFKFTKINTSLYDLSLVIFKTLYPKWLKILNVIKTQYYWYRLIFLLKFSIVTPFFRTQKVDWWAISNQRVFGTTQRTSRHCQLNTTTIRNYSSQRSLLFEQPNN